ncbi:hypothetical protein [Arthrobacter rhizosphaerae]|uniref:hypothetical protein n=1 Tax=Arthrobacter rhizosphaerae TaxID=2855490 RepID=UPI001FF19477|nr:hypothetical protein [Arthrobacter rhizosphaerae]
MTDEQFAELVRAIQDNGLSITDWIGALASLLTFLIAAAAVWIAWGQLQEASSARKQTKKLEREKSQPYVVAFLEESAVGSHILDLVVRNYGQTAGRNIRFSFEPALNRTDGNGGEEDVILPDLISFLAPGQEWRTLFDVTTERAHREDLPLLYKGVVSYEGIDNEPQKSDVVIDLHPFKARIFPEILGVHHAAKALQDISKNQKQWSETPRGIKVYSRDGDAKDTKVVESAQRWKARREAERATEARNNPTEV